jgi:hypothetical protein
MGRKVKAESSVHSCQDDFDIPKLCDDRNLHATFRTPITWTYNAWIGSLDQDRVDEFIIEALVGVLEKATWIVADVKDRFDLPSGWTSDDANWDRYRKAIAVTLLQSFYDSLP